MSIIVPVKSCRQYTIFPEKSKSKSWQFDKMGHLLRLLGAFQRNIFKISFDLF